MSRILVLVLLLGLGACTRAEPPAARFEAESRTVAARGLDPSLLVASSGRILALVATIASDERRGLVLHSSEDGGDSFHPLHRLDGGGDVESHGEGRPLLRVGPRHEHYAVWSERDGSGTKTLRFSRSVDFLHSFSAPAELAVAGGATFFDLAVAPGGALVLAWLAHEPVPDAPPGSASIRLSTSSDRGETWSDPVRAVAGVCPCCRPRLALAAGTGFLAWRGVDAENVRDVRVGRLDETYSRIEAEAGVAADGWRIEGCPHSGPSIAIDRGRLWVAWATGAGGSLRAQIASSTLEEISFAARPVAETLADANHPDLVSGPSGVWLVFQARPVAEDGGFAATRAWLARVDGSGPVVPIAAPAGNGSVLYPAIAPLDVDKLLVAWTDSTAEGTGVVAARARLARSDVVR